MPTQAELDALSASLAPLTVDELATTIVRARYEQTSAMAAIASLLNLISTVAVQCEINDQAIVVDTMRSISDAIEASYMKTRKMH